MENKKLKKSKIGRKPYIANKKLLKELYEKIKNKEITNEERLANSTVVKKQNGMKLKRKWRQFIMIKDTDFLLLKNILLKILQILMLQLY